MAVTDEAVRKPAAKRKPKAKAPAPTEVTTEYMVLVAVPQEDGSTLWREEKVMKPKTPSGGGDSVTRQYKQLKQDEFQAMPSAEKVAALDAPPHRFRVVVRSAWDPEESITPELRLA